jgi:hypothetical protein
MEHLEDFGSPGRIYVIGAGKNGFGHYRKLPQDIFTIAVNRMLLYPRAWTIWMAFDFNSLKQDFWSAPKLPGTKFVLGTGLARQCKAADYFFNSGGGCPRTEPITLRGLRGGATISCCALQLAWFLGADHITLVGVDMKGDRHFDGTRAAKSNHVWTQRGRFQVYIDILRSRGLQIDSLSETALNVPVVRG